MYKRNITYVGGHRVKLINERISNGTPFHSMWFNWNVEVEASVVQNLFEMAEEAGVIKRKFKKDQRRFIAIVAANAIVANRAGANRIVFPSGTEVLQEKTSRMQRRSESDPDKSWLSYTWPMPILNWLVEEGLIRRHKGACKSKVQELKKGKKGRYNVRRATSYSINKEFLLLLNRDSSECDPKEKGEGVATLYDGSDSELVRRTSNLSSHESVVERVKLSNGQEFKRNIPTSKQCDYYSTLKERNDAINDVYRKEIGQGNWILIQEEQVGDKGQRYFPSELYIRSFLNHGRLYSTMTTIRSEERVNQMFSSDGGETFEKIVGLDVVACQATLLAHVSKNIEIPEDIYEIEGQSRNLVKAAFVRLVHCKDIDRATLSLEKHLVKEKSIEKKSAKALSRSVIDSIRATYPEIVEEAEKWLSNDIMKLDGEINGRIMQRLLVEEETFVYGVHDCWFHPESKTERVREIIEEVYSEVLEEQTGIPGMLPKLKKETKMTKEQQIGKAFTELARLNKPKAYAVLNRISEMDAGQQLALIELELQELRDQAVQDTKFDMASILGRFNQANDQYDPAKEVIHD